MTAPERVVEPSPERRAHGRVTRAEQQIADSRGDIGQPFRAEGLLAQLERRGAITPQERHAGEEFHRLFRMAALDPLRATDASRVYVVGALPIGINHGSEYARRKLNAALDALGGHGSRAASCAWFMLGLELSMREWARRETWAGRPMREEAAKGALSSTLGVLVGYFRLG